MQGTKSERGRFEAGYTPVGPLILLVLVVVIVGVSIFFYFRTSGAVSSLQGQLATANSQISSLQTQLATANSQISSLQTQLASVQTQLTAANSQISALQSELSSANSQVSGLQTQLTSTNSQVSGLQTQLTAANSQISSLQSQNTNLQSIVNLSLSSTQASSVPVSQAPGQLSTIATFTASYAGYVVVSGSSTSSTGYVKVTSSFSNYPYNNWTYPFGVGATLYIPVLPGTVSVYFGNSEPQNSVTATISVVYYY